MSTYKVEYQPSQRLKIATQIAAGTVANSISNDWKAEVLVAYSFLIADELIKQEAEENDHS